MAEWHTKDSVRTVWSSAPDSDDLVEDLLAAAQIQILEFLGLDTETPPDTIPATYRIAHGLQTRAIWDSQTASVGAEMDQIGGEYPVRVYSMAKPVRELLRPQHSIPEVG